MCDCVEKKKNSECVEKKNSECVNEVMPSPINGFGISEGYIFTMEMTNEFNNKHHQHLGIKRA